MDAADRLASPSRRTFLKGGAGLTVCVLAAGVLHGTDSRAQSPAAMRSATAWVRIGTDGAIEIRIGSAEMGQGISTALPLVLAEELDADWDQVQVRIETHDARTFGNPHIGGILYTAGSTSMAAYRDTLRKAGATARRMLVHTAARQWDVSPDAIHTEPSMVVHGATGRRMSYGEVVQRELVTDVPEITPADYKPVSAYRLVGTSIGRLDVPAKTRGAEQYTMDVRVPGMVYAVMLRAPVEGEQAESMDDQAARALPGVVAVVKLPEAVAVVADRVETAMAARRLLQVRWTTSSPMRLASSEGTAKEGLEAARDLSRGGTPFHSAGDAPALLAGGSTVIEASYATAPAYHAQLEPLAAVASVDADGKGAEIWFGTQSQTLAIGVACGVLQTTPDRIRFHLPTMGGGFGRRTYFARENLRDALLLSRAVQRPVKLFWSREDDLKNGWFRPAITHHLRASLSPEGRVTAWHHRVAAGSIMAYYSREMYEQRKGRDMLVMEGAELGAYQIPNMLVEHLPTTRGSRIAALRGIGTGHNTFATESFMDQLARAARLDPVAFRRQMTAPDSKARRVLDEVVTMSGFGKAAKGRAHGIALGAYGSSLAAGVAEISLDRASGLIRVHRFWVAYDAGLPVQPRNLDAQVEGAVVYGLSLALKEGVTLDHGEVQQSNFHDYPILRSSECPVIQVRSVPTTSSPSSAGELGIPVTAAAVGNAFATLTGHRLTELPFSPQQVRAAIAG